MILNVNNPYYWMYPALGLAVCLVLYFLLRRRSPKVQDIVLFALLAANFALHFLKLLFPPYSEKEFADAIQSVTPENVCAINTMLFPFLFLKKGGVLRDYMFYIGVISGIAATFIPESIENSGPFDFDTIRYYFCHTILWTVPLLMVVFGRHKLNYRRIGLVPLMYLLALAIIVVNEVSLVTLGYDSLGYLLKCDHGNGGMAFGPYPDIDESLLKILLALVPDCFTPAGTGDYYVPVLWQLFPVYVIGCPVGFLMALYWERKRFISDVKFICSAVARPFRQYRFGRRKIKFGARFRRTGRRCRRKL